MYLIIEDNPNCPADERVFSEKGTIKQVQAIQYELPHSQPQWWDITGMDDQGQLCAAQAVPVEDSGAGLVWLIFGGTWGLRFRVQGSQDPWSIDNKNQWGAAFKVLDFSGADIQFKDSPISTI